MQFSLRKQPFLLHVICPKLASSTLTHGLAEQQTLAAMLENNKYGGRGDPLLLITGDVKLLHML